MIDELTELEVSTHSLSKMSKNLGTNGDSEVIELTDEMIENYFKALQQVSQNKVHVQIDEISEMSKESDVTKKSVLEAVPATSKEEMELKSMISLLDRDALTNMT